MSSIHPDDLETLPATRDGNGDGDGNIDSESNAVLRAIAYSPPRRPASVVVAGTTWGEAGRYRIDRRLGRGGMGSVYAATDTVLERVVALKVLDATDVDQDAAYKKLVLREAKLAARVEHERIARVYDVGSHDGLGFVAMEYIHGDTLRHWMAGRKVPVPQIVDIAIQIAEGLAALHMRGVVHRDLKPENVMLTAQGTVKLLDFGLARSAVVPGDAGMPGRPTVLDGTSIAAASGTPGYMAPEQFAGQAIDERVDIFALGIIIHELVTGERVFRGDTVGAIMQATLAWEPELRDAIWRSVPEKLRDHTARMLARDPEDRFKDGTSALAGLHALRGEISLQPAELPEAIAQPVGQAPAPLALVRAQRGHRRPGLARKGIELTCALTAVIFLAIPQEARPPLSPTPRGMVLVDVGTIHVGADEGELDRECAQIGPGCDRDQLLRDVPRTEVTIAPFFLDRYEVTNEQFARMLNEFANATILVDDRDDHYPRFVHRSPTDTPQTRLIDLYAQYGGIEPVNRSTYRARPGREKLPVVQVSWYGAKLYCESLGKRLPTEDEWEAAARGRDNRRFPWGNDLPRCGEVAIPNDGLIRPVSSTCPRNVEARLAGTSPKDVTPEGVHDLAGNVSEWTSSVWIEGKRAAQVTAGSTDTARVIRGGSWGNSLMARSSGRTQLSPSVMGANVGFRCASNAQDAKP
ncbi:MAG TPA: bifunctional serine/threonine-protein kinase/formylglycine-generating enzyme family protein [Kofleriaceae bacterium]|jgi:formylglycine-generating enzyme required for sulfatase activity/predicted Ser/Thr protein kinase|nr:bifunctional serine/threonine-protein kinase/formylglycine-generating enzyme family protein [Kofleriaceae bacterium]